MLEAFSTSRNRTRTLLLLATCGLLIFAAVTVGIDDNLPGLLLAFFAAVALTVSFVHPWKTSRRYKWLMAAAGIGLIVFVVLHNVFDVIASAIGTTGLGHDLLVAASIVSFFVAILLCPPAFCVGVVGAIVLSRREKST